MIGIHVNSCSAHLKRSVNNQTYSYVVKAHTQQKPTVLLDRHSLIDSAHTGYQLITVLCPMHPPTPHSVSHTYTHMLKYIIMMSFTVDAL